MRDKASQPASEMRETAIRSPAFDHANPAANEPLQAGAPGLSRTTSPAQPDWTDWQPPGPAIPPHQLTRVCEGCQTLNRDTAQYCRHCARKLLPPGVAEPAETATGEPNGRPEPHLALDEWPPVRKSRGSRTARRVLGIPVPPGVDASIVWLLLVLAVSHGAFVLWYLGRSAMQNQAPSLPASTVRQPSTEPESRTAAATLPPPATTLPPPAAPVIEARREPDPPQASEARVAEPATPAPRLQEQVQEDPAPAPSASPVETAAAAPAAE
ncbi:MAG TPA: hypothetical protein VJ832_08535, partial [Variovorax sp.]|nr:hypothetical protein [Variovorax sp.]